MEKQEKKTKFERATHDQLICFVNFCKVNPNFQTGKNNPKAPQQMQQLWGEIANRMNSLRGPTRSPAKWKETLTVWKSQLRTRARRLKMEQRLTGGGPSTGKKLSDLEEMALATFGAAAVDGINETSYLGVPSISSGQNRELSSEDSVPPSPTFIPLAQSPANLVPPSPTSIPLAQSPANSVPTSPTAFSFDFEVSKIESEATKTTREKRKEWIKRIEESIKRRNELEQARQELERQRDEREKQRELQQEERERQRDIVQQQLLQVLQGLLEKINNK